MNDVFIIGSKGIPAKYGGFETFVEKLTQYQVSPDIRYHVACLGKDKQQYEYHKANCFHVPVPNIGSAKAVYYDIAALKYCIHYCKSHPEIRHPVFYVLACRIGPFMPFYKKEILKLEGTLFINPDGHEWNRKKWSRFIRKYWKISENLMVKYADLVICDSTIIEKYIQVIYKKHHPKTQFIPYGADTGKSILLDTDSTYTEWLKSKELTPKEYYLVVGRFVPENNFEIMIHEFMNSQSQKDFAIITTANDAFLKKLEKKLHFKNDKRIKFVGTVYNQELLKKIRENAYGYMHGHEVGGTNPSLLEALSSSDLNLLLDVGFNKEVGIDAALYWSKKEGSLAALINRADKMSSQLIKELGDKSKKRILEAYNWNSIVAIYESIFLKKRG